VIFRSAEIAKMIDTSPEPVIRMAERAITGVPTDQLSQLLKKASRDLKIQFTARMRDVFDESGAKKLSGRLNP
jgi:hypothetical protein